MSMFVDGIQTQKQRRAREAKRRREMREGLALARLERRGGAAGFEARMREIERGYREGEQ